MKLKAEDIVFFIVIGLALFVLLWLLHGSPTLDNALISIGTFIITSEVLLWRKYFEIDKSVSNGFTKVKSDFEIMKSSMNHLGKGIRIELDYIKEKLNKIEGLIKK